MKIITCIAPVNIAVIKYWGKRDEELILPLNDSLSSTLSTAHMCAKTTIRASPDLNQNTIFLNGKQEDFTNKRLTQLLTEVKKRADPNNPLLQSHLEIVSENNFPTAAGLASSAAGYACLAFALARLFGLEGDISGVARSGSGSACRSVLGGWVRWHRGRAADGRDSVASQVAPAAHWPEMRVLVLVVTDRQKKCSSTEGMRRSAETSQLLRHRAAEVVPARVAAISEAILARNFEDFGRITMQDSNQFHAVCLDTYPPCVYMNDVSHAIAELVHAYNAYKAAVKVAYTFDAGPNACLYLLENDVEEVLGLVNETFPNDKNDFEYFRGENVAPKITNLRETLKLKQNSSGLLNYVICTKVGEGPQVLKDEREALKSKNY